MLKLTYKNKYGSVEMAGGGKGSPLRITNIEGLGLAEMEHTTVSYAGSDGQETVSSRALPRSITVSGDVCATSAAKELRRAVGIVCEPGYLYISDGGEMQRRIFCSQTVFPDAERILQGKIAAFAMQFVCDNPFFEDAEDTAAKLYSRTKNLSTTFTLPCTFGSTSTGASIMIDSRRSIEPIIKIYTPVSTSSAETVTITNAATGKSIKLALTYTAGDVLTIDVKNRTVVSTKLGNIADKLSDDTYLGEFRLIGGKNTITAAVGSISSRVTIECVYNNQYDEAMII